LGLNYQKIIKTGRSDPHLWNIVDIQLQRSHCNESIVSVFSYFYVVALKLKEGEEPTSSGSYENSELVTYAEARKSTNSKPYIAAVVTSSGVDGTMFVLGDGRDTSDPTSLRRRSTSSDYYNGPLESGSSYSIFQRIVLSDKVWYFFVITL
jgi:hypothetical protein